MQPKSKVELYAAIRRDSRAGLASRALQSKYGVGFRTIEKALASVWPEPRKPLPPRRSRLDSFKPLIDQMLRTDLDAPRKQRHTAKRIFDRLLEEHDADQLSYGMVRDYARKRRPEIRLQEGRDPPQVFIEQSHRPGAEAEVDFGDVWIRLAGELTRCYLFSFRLSWSGKAIHRMFLTCSQEAFFEGHVHAMTMLGGLPSDKVRYDNLKPAVAKVLGFSRARVESERWVAFRSWAGIEAFYCRPGVEGAHEKGGVEGQIGWFRRNHFVPVPDVASLAELNALIDSWDRHDERRRIRMRTQTIGERFAQEQSLLRPLPIEPFEIGRLLTPRVNLHSQITVRTNRYSVPIRLAGHPVRVMLFASHLVVYHKGVEVARHERLIAKGGARLELDHYLEALAHKPGALAGATALEQARAAGTFTATHEAWWAAARKAHGEAAGTGELIEVLLLHRHMAHHHVVAGIAAALKVGALSADVVALEARKIAQAGDGSAAESALPRPEHLVWIDEPAVISLTTRRLAQLPPDTRPLPSVAVYDQLLRRRTGGAQPASEGETP
ncbi:IS21 family transposase [Planomonospora sp. ID67723]|uniref:IS21 family transposase n=1 Tax=Planomonospora sp. ID67723 TaxID=2738134 RepID=UPI0018C43C4E|nr:IS21 family transposase [Planomonospora sp. ID67723]MBG0831626.1 IS21 family transposase [Planomonospora sp. ID67723]